MTTGGGTHGVSAPIAVVFAAVGFFALVIAGYGLLSLATDAEVIPVSGLGPVPGALALAGAVLAFVGGTATLAARRPAPRYRGVWVVVAGCFVSYLAGVLVGGVLVGVDPARVVAALGAFATSWFAVVLSGAALVSAWTAVALVRTRAGRPQWPWERGEP